MQQEHDITPEKVSPLTLACTKASGCRLDMDCTTITLSGSRSFSDPDATKPMEDLRGASLGVCTSGDALLLRLVPEDMKKA